MSSLQSFKDPAAYHLLSYGTLLGSTLFQSFIAGVIAFRALPRPQFSTLQKNTFPAYFTLQTVTPAILAATYPRGGAKALLTSLTTNPFSSSRATSSFFSAARNAPKNTLPAYLIATMLVTGLVNLVYVGPQTTEIMRLRKHQETRDGKKSYDSGPQSKEMKELNRKFGILHGISSLVNLVGFGAMVWYGVWLAEGLDL